MLSIRLCKAVEDEVCDVPQFVDNGGCDNVAASLPDHQVMAVNMAHPASSFVAGNGHQRITSEV